MNEKISTMESNSRLITHNSSLKKGYKQTEVGVIPEDWGIPTMDSIAKVIDSLHRTPKFSNDGYPMVRVSDIKLGNLNLSKTLKVNEDVYLQFIKPYKPQQGDIVLSRVGSYGIPSFVDTIGPFCIGQNAVIISTNENKRFLYHVLSSKGIKEQIENGSYGSGYKSLSLKNIKELKIPLPPTRAEQTAIATALSDMDALIEGLEKLIAKKQNIKQGAMQELLTPKEGWKVKTMSEIGKTYGGLSGKSKNDFENGTTPYIPFMNVISNPIIDTAYLDYVNMSNSENQNKALKGDLFFNTSSETPEEVGMCSVLLKDVEELYLNSFCFGFRFYKEIKDVGLYLSYFFRSSYGRKKLFLLAQGATRYNLSKSNFLKLELELPTQEEQIRIANILSDMDNEIEKLETQLFKYKMIKIGMMQELLTGKKRLI